MALATCLPAPPLETLELMEPGGGAAPFNGAAWTFALALPGYRMLAELGAGTDGGARGARLRSRHGVDATRWFPEVARALRALRLPGRAVLDGTLCVLDAAGRPDPQRLHERALHHGRRRDIPVVLCLQDLLVWQGRDVRTLPWLERQQWLRGLPLHGQRALRLPRTVQGEGWWLWRQAQALGLDGVQAHRRDAPYVAGPSIGWLRIPCAAPEASAELAA